MKNLTSKHFTFVCIFSLLISVCTANATGLASIIVKVSDETGMPVESASLNIRFSSNSSTIKGKTDSKGIFETKAFSNDGVILCDITKDGYYEGGIAHSFYRKSFGMWQPWGKELTVVMRSIVNPVPMYVRNRSFKVPVKGQEVGFDLEKADWVIPYGQGTTADFVFKIEQHYESSINYDVNMTLTFSNDLDGIQILKDDGGGDFNIGSSFRLLRTAPSEGYLTKLERHKSWGTSGKKSDFKDDNNYIFRVRSEMDENGKLKRAMYGKIRGELRYSPGAGGSISMHYYLNPDYTPNLEFDPKRNLFISLPSDENVLAP